MDVIGLLTGRLPLVARPRPVCRPLAARIGDLLVRAEAADRAGDLAAASAVHNQAALIASDCGLPDQARGWCRRHAEAYLGTGRRLDAQLSRCALEPVVNLARLHTRAGNGLLAFELLDTLYEAVSSGSDTVIDGVAVPIGAMTAVDADQRALRRWLWGVHLADGTRGLTSAGRWQQAHDHLRGRHGIGRSMLEGRQVAVIASAAAGELDEALALLAATVSGEPWQNAVTACLELLCRRTRRSGDQRPDELGAELGDLRDRYRRVEWQPSLAVFHARLGLCALDAVGDGRHPVAGDIAATLIEGAVAAGDGYAARDVLAHGGCRALLTEQQRRTLSTIVDVSALGAGEIPAALATDLKTAVATSEAVLSRRLGTW